MDIYISAISNIIKEQQSIIGPVALDQAKRVAGLSANSVEDIKIQGNGKDVLGHLVERYEKFFGKASIEVCKEAIASLGEKIAPNQLPDILKN